MVDVVIGLDFSGHYQWSFRKIGTMGTLASKAEIDAWVQTPGSLMRGSGSITPEILVTDCMVCKIWCIFGRKIVRSAVYNALLTL